MYLLEMWIFPSSHQQEWQKSSGRVRAVFADPHCLHWDSLVLVSSKQDFASWKENLLTLWLWLGMVCFSWVTFALQATPILLIFCSIWLWNSVLFLKSFLQI